MRSGGTAAPQVVVTREETCTIANPGQDWRFKGYTHFHHTELVLKFETTLYRRSYYQTPEGTVTAPLPEHVKSRFGDNLKAHLLNFYHSCSTTQPLMLAWLHDHGCPISTGALNKILTEGHDLFHEEKEELREAGLSCSRYLQVDDTGARHQGKNGYCLFIGNPLFAYFHSSDSKSRMNFLRALQGQEALYILDSIAIDYMKQVKMSQRWVAALSVCGTHSFASEKEWEEFLDAQGCTAPQQRRWATEGVLKAALMSRYQLDRTFVHSDGARQFDTVFPHGLCWFHAGRPLDKLIPANECQRSARDWMQAQYWNIYDDIDAYRKNPTEAQKRRLAMDFDHWITTQVDYLELQKVLGQLMVVRDELLLVLEYPWLPMHNNLSERQIREYVKRRKVSGGTRSTLGRKCRDTFASLKKTCKLHGISFAHYLKDRISGLKKIPRLGELVLAAASGQKVASA